MSSEAIVTLIKIMESLPEAAQEQVVEHLREYIENMRDELQWNSLFKKTQQQLIAAARRAKQEIAEGQATPLDYDQL
jgi:gamma-glutamyl:cysteine ligase YbdK (ATP-grasp superfamily)